jgi:hypothetical protein
MILRRFYMTENTNGAANLPILRRFIYSPRPIKLLLPGRKLTVYLKHTFS